MQQDAGAAMRRDGTEMTGGYNVRAGIEGRTRLEEMEETGRAGDEEGGDVKQGQGESNETEGRATKQEECMAGGRKGETEGRTGSRHSQGQKGPRQREVDVERAEVG